MYEKIKIKQFLIKLGTNTLSLLQALSGPRFNIDLIMLLLLLEKT